MRAKAFMVRKVKLFILMFFILDSLCVAQKHDSVTNIELTNAFGIDSIQIKLAKLKSKQGLLSDCEFAIENATDDFHHSVFSFHSPEFYPPECTYCDVLQMDYKIAWYFVDDTFSEEYYTCYDSIMTLRLKTIYGDDFQKRAREKADSLETTDNWRKDAQFPGGVSELMNFIHSRITGSSFIPDTLIKTRLTARIEIDSSGRVINQKIIRGINPDIDKKVLEVLMQLPDFSPAYLRGKPTRQLFYLPINFDSIEH